MLGTTHNRVSRALLVRLLDPGNVRIVAVTLDDLRVDIRQQGIGNVLGLGKLLQGLPVVIGHRIQFDAVGFKPGVGISQLT